MSLLRKLRTSVMEGLSSALKAMHLWYSVIRPLYFSLNSSGTCGIFWLIKVERGEGKKGLGGEEKGVRGERKKEKKRVEEREDKRRRSE